MIMNPRTLARQAQALHDTAAQTKPMRVEHQGVTYLLVWNGSGFTAPADGQEVVRCNTRKVTHARKWLRQWLES